MVTFSTIYTTVPIAIWLLAFLISDISLMCPLAMSGNIFKHSGTLCKSTLENFWQTSGMSTFEQTPTALFNKVLTQILYNGRESLVLCSMITSSEVVARSSKIQSFSRIQGCFLSKLFFLQHDPFLYTEWEDAQFTR